MNSLIPVITQIGFVFAGQFGGAVVAETVFSIPGLGTYMIISSFSLEKVINNRLFFLPSKASFFLST